MKTKITQIALTGLLISFIMPNLAAAAWWNPFTWGWFNRTPNVEKELVATSTMPISIISTTSISTTTNREIKRIAPIINSSREDRNLRVTEALKLIAEQNALIAKQKELLTINDTPIKTQNENLCLKINSLIEDGIIPPNKINSARAAAGCKTPNIIGDEEIETNAEETPAIRPHIIAVPSSTNNTVVTEDEDIEDNTQQVTPTLVVESNYSDYNFNYDWSNNILSCPMTSRNIVIKKAVFKVSGSELQKLNMLKGLESDGFRVQLLYPRLVYASAANNRNNAVFSLEKRDQSTYIYLGGSIPVCTNGDTVFSSYEGVISDTTAGGRNISAYLSEKGISIETSNGTGGDTSITPGSSNATFIIEMTPVMSEWEVFDNTQKKPVEIQ